MTVQIYAAIRYGQFDVLIHIRLKSAQIEIGETNQRISDIAVAP